MLQFNGRDAGRYRIGINAAVRFAPNLYPVLSRIPLPIPRQEEDDTPTTTDIRTYENIALRHEVKCIRILQNEALDETGRPDGEENFVLRITRRFADHIAEWTRSAL